ncbi:transposase InsO family protein [Streptosporangium album]|uniref:Transposase InsO family protein n=1 Tax=Streptosporangium album TaxID=47479 RepID=A0A7W7S5P1_9ACTN|nr:transposase InsO family protein [Streptosporangium album]
MATVIDCHSKAVIGWAMADHYRTELIKDAIRMAAATGLLQPDAVFHSEVLQRFRTGRCSGHQSDQSTRRKAAR